MLSKYLTVITNLLKRGHVPCRKCRPGQHKAAQEILNQASCKTKLPEKFVAGYSAKEEKT